MAPANRKLRAVHIAMTAAAWGVLLASLIHLAFIWGSLDETLGVHFDSEGEFDVFASKCFIAYPYAVGFGALLLCGAADFVIRKIKVSSKLDETGTELARGALYIHIDVIKLTLSVFWAYWAHCVKVQHKLDTLVPNVGCYLLMANLMVFIIAYNIIKKRHKIKA